MSYLDQSRRSSPTSIAVVVGVHLVIAYAIISGLAYTVIHGTRPPTIVTEVPTEIPPPPHPEVLPPKTRNVTPTTVVPEPNRDDLLKNPPPLVPTFMPPDIGNLGNGSGGELTPSQPPRPSQAREPIAGADRLRWITTEDYPAAALREGVQGSVVLSATIGANGRVQSCVVTQSSGSQLLDDTTCRLYTRRAHFTPARDADGNPISAQRSDRFRWQIPNE